MSYTHDGNWTVLTGRHRKDLVNKYSVPTRSDHDRHESFRLITRTGFCRVLTSWDSEVFRRGRCGRCRIPWPLGGTPNLRTPLLCVGGPTPMVDETVPTCRPTDIQPSTATGDDMGPNGSPRRQGHPKFFSCQIEKRLLRNKETNAVQGESSPTPIHAQHMTR